MGVTGVLILHRLHQGAVLTLDVFYQLSGQRIFNLLIESGVLLRNTGAGEDRTYVLFSLLRHGNVFVVCVFYLVTHIHFTLSTNDNQQNGSCKQQTVYYLELLDLKKKPNKSVYLGRILVFYLINTFYK